MPSIDTYLAKIREAVYGEEVRGSIHDAIEMINNVVANWEAGLMDTTLTSTELPAQGKAVGDEITDIKDLITRSTASENANLLNFQKLMQYTVSGVTVSGSIVSTGINLNGTAQSTVAILLSEDSVILEPYIQYALYEADASDDIGYNGYELDLRQANNFDNKIIHEFHKNGCVFSVSSTTEVKLFMRVASGYTFVNKTIYPVLKKRTDNADKLINLWSPSMLNPIQESGGVDVINNLDGTISLDGTPSAVSATSLTNDFEGFPLTGGHTYIFTSKRKDIGVEDVFAFPMIDLRAGNNNTVSREYTTAGGIFTPATTGLYKMFVRVPQNYTLNNYVIRPQVYDISQLSESTPKRLRVCAFNVGNFAMGESGTSAGNDAIYDGLVQTFKAANADVYMFSEWDEYWNADAHTKSKDVLGFLKPYKTLRYDKVEDRYVCQMIYSDYEMYGDNFVYFADGESRSYVDEIIIMNGKPVHFICAHLPWSSVELRRDDIDKIFNYIHNNNIEYFVIGGDMNLGLGDETRDVLTVARLDVTYFEVVKGGCTSAQGGPFGDAANDHFMNTYNTDNSVEPYDNIVVSNNIMIRNAFVVEGTGSDHYAFCADIEVM